MATELENRCPICLDSWDNVAYVIPCLHRFCYMCILQWAESKPECPLCKGRVLSIMHSVWGDEGFDEHDIPPPAASPVVDHQAEGAAGHATAHIPAAAQPQPVEMVPRAPPGGFQSINWSSLFREHPALLQIRLTWVDQEMGWLFWTQSPRAATLRHLMSALLVFFGLYEDILVQMLQPRLQNHLMTFVHPLIDMAMQRCSGEAHRLLSLEDGRAAREREGSPGAAPGPAASQGRSPTPGSAPSSGPEGDNVGDRPSTSAAVLLGGPGSPPSAPLPIPGEQQEPQEEAAPGPSSPSRGRERSPGGPGRAVKRRAGSPEGSSPAAKRPPDQQH